MTILETDGQDLFKDVLHPRQQVMTDQIIDERYRNNLTDMDKVPDVVRSLREFNGNQLNSAAGRNRKDSKIYEPSIGTPKYFGILNVIHQQNCRQRGRRIRIYNTPLNWIATIPCIMLISATLVHLNTK
ncbi:Retrovirus-related Gag polyprotein from transposon HMS-Beagle [Eumeta japonica]|uniref:Retrovirus-related Gag polyprotein from transposon HMS-Beagle n=1 Tax=Eumeta variegata TaxID=151549 RepID=A0A4C1SY25_EUMVA|nr:Retrovirus-related Gag polyprotein from transposon HMS-Beagle [Eumeta japonica]